MQTVNGEQPSGRWSGRPISRRAALKLAATATGTLAAGLLAACGGGAPAAPGASASSSAAATQASGSAAASAAPKIADELVVAFSLDPGHLDPRVEAGVPGWSMFGNIFDG